MKNSKVQILTCAYINYYIMKKIIAIILIVFTSLFSQAQSRLEWGVKAGWNISYPIEANKPSFGFNVGISGQFNFSKMWFLDAGLRINYKPWHVRYTYGKDNSWNQTTLTENYSANPFILELPIHIGANFNISSSTKIFLAVGPYVGTGLFGKTKVNLYSTTSTGNVNDDTENYHIYGDNPYASKRFEIGVDASVGVEICNHYRISADYLFQLNNPAANLACPIGRSQVFSINFGYKF